MALDKIEQAPAESVGKANIDSVSLLSQYNKLLKSESSSQDFFSALRGKIYPEKEEKETRDASGKAGSEVAMRQCGIKDMSAVDETKIPKDDVKQQAEWLLWKASETNPGKSGKMQIPIPKNFSDSIVDKIATGTLKKQFEDEGYRNMKKGVGDRGQRLLSLTRD